MSKEQLKAFIEWLYDRGYAIADEEDLLSRYGALTVGGVYYTVEVQEYKRALEKEEGIGRNIDVTIEAFPKRREE